MYSIHAYIVYTHVCINIVHLHDNRLHTCTLSNFLFNHLVSLDLKCFLLLACLVNDIQSTTEKFAFHCFDLCSQLVSLLLLLLEL